MLSAAFAVAGELLKKFWPAFLIVGVYAAGFGSGEVWEHRGPQKFPLSVAGDSLRVQRDKIAASIPEIQRTARDAGAKAQADADRPAFDAWKTSLKSCRDEATAARDRAAAALAKADAFTRSQASAAYDLGRASCGVSNATPSSGPGGPASALGLRDAGQGPDLGDLLNAGAFTPRP